MSLLTRMRSAWNAARSRKTADPKIAGLFAAPPAARPAGWWRNDHVEQLRNYTSWVYAAVNAFSFHRS